MPNNTQQKNAIQWLDEDFAAQIITRGQNIYRRGQIRSWDIQQNPAFTRIRAEIEGDTGNVYDTILLVRDNTIASHCTCPYQYQYKHGAALGILYYCDMNTTPQRNTTHNTAYNVVTQ